MMIGSQGSMKVIFHLQESTPDDGIDIVVIPGVWTQYGPEERKRGCSWLKPLSVATENDVRVSMFTYELQVGAKSLWKQLLSQAQLFLTEVVRTREADMQKRPLVFICHSLGGIILKKALWIAHQSQSQPERIIEDVTAGIIFLGTPHLTSESDSRWENWRLILKAKRKEVPKDSFHDGDVANLATTCREFQNLSLPVHILSVYETLETKVRESLLQSLRYRPKKLILVDKDHAETRATSGNDETLVGAVANHHDLGNIRAHTDLYEVIVKYFRRAADDAPGAIAALLNDPLDDYSSTWKTHSDKASAKFDVESVHQGATSLDNQLRPDESKHSIQFPLYSMKRALTKDFFGREEVLTAIEKSLLPQEQAQDVGAQNGCRSFVLYGMGGVGKTEAAIAFMHTRRDKFDAIFWVDADNEQKLSTGFAQISRELRLQDRDSDDDPVALRELAKGWLCNPVQSIKTDETDVGEASWLLVMDNVNDPDLLHDYWPVTGRGSILLTSRNPVAKDGIYATSEGLNLSPMHIGEAVSFLSRLAKRDAEHQSVELYTRIAQTLGGLPLALVLMAAIIRRQHLSLREFLDYYDEDAKDLHDTVIPGLTGGQSIASIWALEHLSTAASTLLKLLSILDPDSIPEDILTRNANEVKLDGYPKKKKDYYNARTELINSSLVKRDFETGSLRMHRLVQDVVRRKMESEEMQDVLEAASVLVSGVWPFVKFEERNLTSRRKVCERYFPHISYWNSTLGGSIGSRDIKPSIRTVALFNEASWFMAERAIFEMCDVLAALSQGILEHLDPDEDENKYSRLLADAHQYQGVAASFFGKSSIGHFEKWLDMELERVQKYHQKEDQLGVPMAYNEIGWAYVYEGSKDEALKSWEMAIDGFKRADPDNETAGTWPAINAALFHAAEGRGDEGEKVLLPILEARDRKFGRDDTTAFETGKTLYAMGRVRVAQGRPDDAMDFFIQAEGNLKVTIGESHIQAADNHYQLACQLIRVGKDHEARDLLTKCIEAYGDKTWLKQVAARSLWKKGRLLRSMNDQVEGSLLLERAMDLRREIAPDDHRPEEELNDSDWDRLVKHYSR